MDAMIIDIYSVNDPWDCKSWSGTNYELAIALKDLDVLGDAYGIRPDEDENNKIAFIIKNFRYAKFYKAKIYLTRYEDERYVKSLHDIALKIYESHPHPEAILVMGDYAAFEETPFFTYDDLDINSILKWRSRGKHTYMFDHVSIDLLEKRHKFQKKVYNKARGIFTASHWVAENIKSYIDEPEKVHSIGMGHRYIPIELDESILRTRFERPEILFIGINAIRKGLDIVLSAFKLIREEIPESNLSVVTNYKMLPHQIMNTLESDSQIHKYMNIQPQKLEELYLRSSIFVMPSRFEPWGKVFFEAMAFGLPVIGAKYFTMPEFIVNNLNGYTVGYEAGEIADRIVSIFNSYEKYENISKNALKTGERYTWKNISKNILKVMTNDI